MYKHSGRKKKQNLSQETIKKLKLTTLTAPVHQVNVINKYRKYQIRLTHPSINNFIYTRGTYKHIYLISGIERKPISCRILNTSECIPPPYRQNNNNKLSFKRI